TCMAIRGVSGIVRTVGDLHLRRAVAAREGRSSARDGGLGLMSLSSGNLASSLSILLLAAVIIGLATGFGVSRARKNGNHTVALSIARTIGLWWALISGLGVVFAIVNVWSDNVSLTGPVLDWVSSQGGALPS